MENNNNKILNVPTLRFKGFKDEWLSLKANEMLESYPTNSLSWEELSFEKGNIKNIHYGLIHKGLPVITNTSDDRIPYLKSDSSSKNRSLMRPGDIIFADASEDYEGVAQAIEIGTVDTPTISGLHTIHAREKNRLYAKGFKGYLFNSPYFKKQVKTLAVGSKVNSISFRNFKDVSLSVPQSLEEQQKIASFLIAIDRRVEIQRKLIKSYESLIKGIIDIEFNKSNKLKCPLRGNIVEKSYRNSGSGHIEILSISNSQGFISQTKQFDGKIIASENTVNYKVVKNGDYAYNPARINVGSIARLKDKEQGIISPMYVCFKVESTTLISDYLEWYLQSSLFKRELISKLVGSVRQVLSFTEMANIEIPVHDINHQRNFSNSLYIIDNYKQLLSKMLISLVELKTALQKSMFI